MAAARLSTRGFAAGGAMPSAAVAAGSAPLPLLQRRDFFCSGFLLLSPLSPRDPTRPRTSYINFS